MLLGLTTAVTPIIYFPSPTVWRVCGPLLIVAFGVYLLSVAAAIARGVLTAPEGSDSDSDSDSDGEPDPETNPLLHPNTGPPPTRPVRPLGRHILLLLLGLALLTLSGYLLSASASALTDQLHLSSILFGVVILALATTLPEKMVALLSGRRGHAGILLANCAGSNIFLLTLCLGAVMAGSGGGLDAGGVKGVELGVLWAATWGLVGVAWFGGGKWAGGAMVAGYVAFVVAEFAVIHGVGGEDL